MSSLLDRVPGGVISLSSDMRILEANGGMSALVGRRPEDLVGRSLDLLLSAPSRILFQTHVYPALKADGRVEEVFLTLATAAGDVTPVLLNAAPSLDRPDAYHALLVRVAARARWEADLVATTRELQRQRGESQRLADELAAAARELEARYADERRLRAFRDAFIGVISHELRSPITTIYGLSHVLRQRHRSLDADSLGQHLDDIHFESDRLRRLTEDLLVLSRAEGGRLIVAAEPVSVARATADSVQSEAGRSSAHHFELEVPSGVPLVAGEQLYVEQIVRNFLSNAAKYSAPGTTIRTSVTPESEGVAVRVRDQGPGIPESPERLFELFYRSPDAATHAPGAGIGLYVCSELVRAMAGRIWAAEAPEGGAEFGFWLPALQEEAAAG